MSQSFHPAGVWKPGFYRARERGNEELKSQRQVNKDGEAVEKSRGREGEAMVTTVKGSSVLKNISRNGQPLEWVC